MAATQALVSTPRKNTDPRIKKFGALARDARVLADRLDAMQEFFVGYDLAISYSAGTARACAQSRRHREETAELRWILAASNHDCGAREDSAS
jgi:hypothetical protein